MNLIRVEKLQLPENDPLMVAWRAFIDSELWKLLRGIPDSTQAAFNAFAIGYAAGKDAQDGYREGH